ncbi:polysaccharide lyase family 7 protein [Pedobacter arcticus]|uniref:polysaccharide lyase family 7 protein n=1 Tax=Pedobacter arcticus TaxID=752140 RepID=UPI0012B585EF|nr:polysaccharide lyase family 7 protein [Pedobacter arcticus]
MQNLSLALLLMSSCATQQVPEKTPTPPVAILPIEVVADKKYPAELIDLSNWKLNTPTDTQTPGKVDEYKQPTLNTFIDANWFHLNANKNGVVFKANAGGVTTSGSGYPRSELREMTDKGAANASWGSSSGVHTLFIEQAIVHLPTVKPHIVIGQIHDANDDVIVFRLEKQKLFIDLNGKNGPTLDNNYTLGKRFTVMFKVHNDQVECYYNDVLVYTYQVKFSGAYFKAGAYVQSSCQGNKKVTGESCDAYGEVEIYKLWVKHE